MSVGFAHVRAIPSIVCGLALQFVACSGRVDRSCEDPAPDPLPVAACVDSDEDGYLVGPDGEACPESEARLEPSDCDDQNPDIHPGNVEWLGDDEDWDCDGLDAPELCLRSGLDWVGELPQSCDEGNLVIQYRQTCDVCRGTDTQVLLRVVSVVAPSYPSNELHVVADRKTLFRVALPEFEGTSPELVVPAVWSVEAYLDFDGCDDPNGFVSAPTLSSSCTL